MVAIRIKGGLGNQLFQYATAYAMAKEKKEELLLDDSFFKTQNLRKMKLCSLNIEYNKILLNEDKHRLCFCINNKYINKVLRILKIQKIKYKRNAIYFLEDRHTDFIKELFKLEYSQVYLDGYFQSYKYFENYRQELLKQFEICLSNKSKVYEEELKKLESVAVHIRRGDFLKMDHKRNTYNYILETNYYFKAIEIIEKMVKNPIYYFFSDDIEWVKGKFGIKENYKYISLIGENADIEELMLMKKCKHIITANSTYSWWAAWLNENENAIRIVPNRAFGNLDMIPDAWIKVNI